MIRDPRQVNEGMREAQRLQREDQVREGEAARRVRLLHRRSRLSRWLDARAARKLWP
ncbi:MAG: hypothetical protein ABI572_12780 [Actinomycetota bacterium]